MAIHTWSSLTVDIICLKTDILWKSTSKNIQQYEGWVIPCLWDYLLICYVTSIRSFAKQPSILMLQLWFFRLRQEASVLCVLARDNIKVPMIALSNTNYKNTLLKVLLHSILFEISYFFLPNMYSFAHDFLAYLQYLCGPPVGLGPKVGNHSCEDSLLGLLSSWGLNQELLLVQFF